MRTPRQADNLDRLIAALRAPELPLTWDFNYVRLTGAQANESLTINDQPARYSPCETVGCARGVAIEIGVVLSDHDPFELAAALGISVYEVVDVFNSPRWYGVDWDDVTPTMVADELEKLK